VVGSEDGLYARSAFTARGTRTRTLPKAPTVKAAPEGRRTTTWATRAQGTGASKKAPRLSQPRPGDHCWLRDRRIGRAALTRHPHPRSAVVAQH
jgi:hypothetical protein